MVPLESLDDRVSFPGEGNDRIFLSSPPLTERL
jgi:hypothetical protein